MHLLILGGLSSGSYEALFNQPDISPSKRRLIYLLNRNNAAHFPISQNDVTLTSILPSSFQLPVALHTSTQHSSTPGINLSKLQAFKATSTPKHHNTKISPICPRNTASNQLHTRAPSRAWTAARRPTPSQRTRTPLAPLSTAHHNSQARPLRTRRCTYLRLVMRELRMEERERGLRM